MNIWLIVLITAVIAGLVTALTFTVKGNLQLQKELRITETRLTVVERELDIKRGACKDLEKKLSFLDGLQLGRKTDTLYRQLLKRCSSGEQFTVMMNGTKEESHT